MEVSDPPLQTLFENEIQLKALIVYLLTDFNLQCCRYAIVPANPLAIYFFLNEQPSFSLSFPPVCWHRRVPNFSQNC